MKEIKKPRKPKILIFEDEAFLREIYADKLIEVGFAVRAFENYLNVIERVVKEKPDILWCSIIVSGSIGGYEAMRLLKSDKRTKDIPIIAVDNLGGKEDIEKALKSGAEKYFVAADYKPSELAELFKDFIRTGKLPDTDKNFEKPSINTKTSIKERIEDFFGALFGALLEQIKNFLEIILGFFGCSMIGIIYLVVLFVIIVIIIAIIKWAFGMVF